jgi:hypothetical protein
MANNLEIKDALNISRIMKTTEEGGVHTPHHILENTTLAPNASTLSEQQTHTQRLDLIANGGTQLKKLIDEVGTTTYICEAPIGTAESTAGWRIKRLSISGSITRIEYAGNGLFNQIANDRLTLSYS